jgi:hypothetical protein
VNALNADGQTAFELTRIMRIEGQFADDDEYNEVRQALLKAGVIVDVINDSLEGRRDTFAWAMRQGVETLKLLHETSEQQCAYNPEQNNWGFLKAIRCDAVTVVRYLLTRGYHTDWIEPNLQYQTPLSASKSVEMAAFLLYHGAPIEDGNGHALLTAAISRQMGLIFFYLDHGANINAKDENNRTILWRLVHDWEIRCEDCAPKQQKISVLECLIEQGADVGIRDSRGALPAHVTTDSELQRILCPARSPKYYGSLNPDSPTDNLLLINLSLSSSSSESSDA